MIPRKFLSIGRVHFHWYGFGCDSHWRERKFLFSARARPLDNQERAMDLGPIAITKTKQKGGTTMKKEDSHDKQ